MGGLVNHFWVHMLGWDIWTDRCRRIFDEVTPSNQANTRDSFFKAAWDGDIQRRCKFYQKNHDAGTVARDRGPEFVRLHTNASVLRSGESSCAGWIADAEGNWSKGYIHKLNHVPPTIAELMAIVHGLHLCWRANYRKVEVYTDSVGAMDLLLRGCKADYPFRQQVDEARNLCMRNWDVLVRHTHRENNTLADRMAKAGHSMVGTVLFFEEPPNFVT